MFKTLIILYTHSFWENESRPNPGRSFPHWLATMTRSRREIRRLEGWSILVHGGSGLVWRASWAHPEAQDESLLMYYVAGRACSGTHRALAAVRAGRSWSSTEQLNTPRLR